MKLKDVLHFYIDANLKVEYGYPDNKKIGILTGFRAGAGWEIWPYKTMGVFVPRGERPKTSAIVRGELLKPIMRRLEDMTEEDFWEAGKMHIAEGGTLKISTGKGGDDDLRLFPNVMAFLISKQYDLFGLIDSNQAFDEKIYKL